MTKRVLMLALSICIAATVICCGAAAETMDSAAQDSIRFLTDLEIITSEIEDSEAPISREEFSVYTARMLRLDADSFKNVRYFIDVEADGYAAGAINALTDRGLISAADDRMFRPLEAVTVGEAAKILVAALGYKEPAEANGGYPSGYMVMASRLGLTAGVGAVGSTMTYGAAFDMLDRALKAQLLSIEVFGSDGSALEYDKSKEYTILKNIWKVYETEGMVTSVYGKTTDSLQESKNEIRIDGTRYMISDNINASEYFGEHVSAYYKTQESNPDRVIVSVKRSGGQNTLKISPEDYIGYSEKTLSYRADSGRTRSIELEKPMFIYNGYPLKENVSERLSEINKGFIEVKDGDGNGGYDMVVISDYRNFVVSAAENGAVYDKLGSSEIIWSDYVSTVVYADGGVAAKEADVKAGQTLSVARSAGGECIEVIISEKEIEGSVTEHKLSDEKHIITVGSSDYTIEKTYAEQIKNTHIKNIPSADVYKICLDTFGNVVYMVKQASDMNAAYIIKGVLNDDSFNSKVTLRLLTDANRFEELELADRIQINNTGFRDAAEAYRAIPGYTQDSASVKSQLIRYSTNTDGRINKILTASYNAWNGESNSGFLALYERTGQQRYTRGKLGERATLTSATKVFFVPNGVDDPEETDCKVSNYSELVDDFIYSSNAYVYNEDGICADALVCLYMPEQLPNNRLYSKPIMMVDSISEKIGESGEIFNCVTGYSLGGKIEYLVPEELSVDGLQEGDLIMFNFDIKGNIVEGTGKNDYTMLVKREDMYKNNRPGWTQNARHDYLYTDSGDSVSDYYRAEFQLSFGYVSNVLDDAVAWDREPDGRFDESARITGNIVIYDSSRRDGQHIYVGKPENIITYKSAGLNCGKIIFRTRSSIQVETFIYQ